MAQVSITPGSWLNLTTLLDFQGITFWDQTTYPQIPYDPDDTFIQLTDAQAHRVDLIAFDQYGDPELLWIILQANDVDLPNQLIEGQVIRIPAKSTVDILLAPPDTT